MRTVTKDNVQWDQVVKIEPGLSCQTEIPVEHERFEPVEVEICVSGVPVAVESILESTQVRDLFPSSLPVRWTIPSG